MTIPTFKTRLDCGGVIGRNIRPGMTPGGMMVPRGAATDTPQTNTERARKMRKKCMEVRDAAMAFLENRVVRTPEGARTSQAAKTQEVTP